MICHCCWLSVVERANGLFRKPFQDKLTQMAINNEITYDERWLAGMEMTRRYRCAILAT